MYRILLSAISVFLFSQNSSAENSTGTSGAHDPRYIEPMTTHHCMTSPSPGAVLNRAILDTVVAATPQEEEAGCRGHYDPAMFTFDVDELGNFSRLHMHHASGLFDRDFWTLYAIASCPPMKPPTGLAPPAHMNVGNMPERIVSTIQGEKNRLSLLHAIPRDPDGQIIAFTLVPASVIDLCPGTFTIDDICQKNNIVAIPLSCLRSPGKKYWTEDDANELLKGHSKISEFLNEWEKFYEKKPHPSKKDLVSFADELKIKYKSLLVEGAQ